MERQEASYGNFAQDEIKNLVYTLLLARATIRQVEIWDGLVPTKFPNLKWSTLKDWVDDTGALIRYGYDQLAYLITCHMGDFNDWVGGTETINCACDSDLCCPSGGDWCKSEDSVPDDDYGCSSMARREDETSSLLMAAPGDRRKYCIRQRDGTVVEIESEDVSEPMRCLARSGRVKPGAVKTDASLPRRICSIILPHTVSGMPTTPFGTMFIYTLETGVSKSSLNYRLMHGVGEVFTVGHCSTSSCSGTD
jgi:hypothetical protein